MRYFKTFSKWVLALFFVTAGVGHFVNEPFFLKIMPDYIPQVLHRPAVIVSGICEVALGLLLLVPPTSRLAAWGLIALLVAVFPANIYAFQHSEELFGVSRAQHFIRLPLQGVLIAWAWWYTRPAPGKHEPTDESPQPSEPGIE